MKKIRCFLCFIIITLLVIYINRNSEWSSNLNNEPDTFLDNLMPIDELNMMYCSIRKNMNSQMLLMLANLLHGKYFEISATIREFSKLWMWHLTHRGNITTNVSVADGIWHNKTVLKLAIVRDPIDRFISAFLQFCVKFPQCHKDVFNKCQANPVCILDLVDSINEVQNWTKYRKEAQITHFAPQYTQCFFRQHWNDYRVIKYENSDKFRQLLRDTMIERGVPVEFLQSGWGTNKGEWLSELTMHQTSVSLGRMRLQMLENVPLMLKIYETYRKDYEFFQFPLPKIVTKYSSCWQKLSKWFY